VSKVAVLVDLGYLLARCTTCRHPVVQCWTGANVARLVHGTARAHVDKSADELFRILVYDCRPLAKRAHNPISGRCIDFARSPTFRFRSELHDTLLRMRKVALRCGELAARNRWIIRERPMKRLLDGKMRLEQLSEKDLAYDITQKGVDAMMSLDIASLAYKRLVERIVLITGDADFVPAAKLARREGLDVILDPLWGSVSQSLHEHIDGLRTHWPRRAP
jgi:uncharacterized LabA/DUF88 family protein